MNELLSNYRVYFLLGLGGILAYDLWHKNKEVEKIDKELYLLQLVRKSKPDDEVQRNP